MFLLRKDILETQKAFVVKLGTILTVIFLIISCSKESEIDTCYEESGGIVYPSEIVINASKGGGAWWYGQGVDCDTTAGHQGKGLVDFLKREGFSVYESCREEDINLGEFPNIKLLIVAGSHLPYSISESKEIACYVRNGGKLMLLLEHTPTNNILPFHLGLQFWETNTNDVIIEFQKHEITGNKSYEHPINGVSGLLKSDNEVDVVARLSEETFLDTNYDGVIDDYEVIAPVVIGTIQFGQGRILFSGDINIWQWEENELFKNAISWFDLR